jgi:hypothetical protein
MAVLYNSRTHNDNSAIENCNDTTGVRLKDLLGFTGIYHMGFSYDDVMKNGDIDVQGDSQAVTVTIFFNEIQMIRKFYLEKKIILNRSIRIKDQGKGIGLSIFSSQVEHTLKAQFNYIQCLAAGDIHRAAKKGEHCFNGYITWAKFGWTMINTDLNNSHFRQMFINARASHSYRSLQELMAAESIECIHEGKKVSLTGVKFWAMKGFDFDAEFKLIGDSTNLLLLEAYKKTKSGSSDMRAINN